MKKMYRAVTAADSGESSKLADMIGQLEDDFDYIISGFEKLDRTGATESNEGLVIAEGLADTFQNVISQISDRM